MSVKIGYIQFCPRLGDKDWNLEKIGELVARAGGADLLVLPELATTGYDFSKSAALGLAEGCGGVTVGRLGSLAAEYGVRLVCGFLEKDEGKLFNSAAVVSPEGFLGVYRKCHLFEKEKEVFTPGDAGFGVLDAGKLRVGVLICFDWIFPEACRVLALEGADVVAHPANLVLPYAQRAMLARSVENRVFTVTANRIGSEGEYRFTGGSQVTSPKMEVLASASAEGEEVAVVGVDLAQARSKKINAYNDLFADRRPEFYGRLAEE